jgi:hypothetical protein
MLKPVISRILSLTFGLFLVIIGDNMLGFFKDYPQIIPNENLPFLISFSINITDVQWQ